MIRKAKDYHDLWVYIIYCVCMLHRYRKITPSQFIVFRPNDFGFHNPIKIKFLAAYYRD